MAAQQSDTDWDTVTYLRKKQPKAHELKSQAAVNQAQRSGAPIETTKKFSGGRNAQHQTDKNTAILDRDFEELKHETVSIDIARTIQQARNAKQMTQKEFATAINEQERVVKEYEQGKAIPSSQVLAKMERVLGVKLRGKN
jgi:putative transcription factor